MSYREQVDVWNQDGDVSNAKAYLDTDDGPRILVVCACGFDLAQMYQLDPFREDDITCPDCRRTYSASVTYRYSVEEYE